MRDKIAAQITEAVAWTTACVWRDAAARQLLLADVIPASFEQRCDFLAAVALFTRRLVTFGDQGPLVAGMRERASHPAGVWRRRAFDVVDALICGDRAYAHQTIGWAASGDDTVEHLACNLGEIAVAALGDLANHHNVTIYDELARWGRAAADIG